ncbi:hypothetical protein Calkr_2118 [Caldicellulosiruptor acetigenus I77R1B]|uniref:Uncharacterized protein n=1 Tax=Caldicellulosiruptor acetigenus (strain ATCC 700853 / DSM 12137 / I77R1B) TaxID=632335 RepID=E4S5S4_CALA7|nr:hypothetical protein [Caldicellulosiruptor acetigenus]ADQ41584.1 hypothetical protein Calkr_2118 [Caldicellulosiruptor acetigenus I77R1B]
MNKEPRIIFSEDFDPAKYKDIEDMPTQEEVRKFVLECLKKSEIAINDRKGFVGDGKTAIVKRISEDEYVVTFYFPYDAVNVSEQKKKDPNYKSVREIVIENRLKQQQQQQQR